MLKRRAFAAGVLAVTLLAAPATGAEGPAPKPAPPAEPAVFTVFRTVCIDHQGDLAGAEAEARKQAFAILPPPPDADPAEVARHTVLVRESEDLPMLIILTRVPDEALAGVGNGEATMCSVSGPDPKGAVAAAAQAWVGLESNSQDGSHTTFLYRQTPNQRVLLADQSETVVGMAVRAGEYRVFDINPEAGGVTLGLMTGRLKPAKP